MTLRLHAIFHRLVKGDEALLRLAQQKFDQAGLLPEFNPGSPDHQQAALAFRPCPGRPFAIHLPRSLKLTSEEGRQKVADFARRFGNEASALVVHDEEAVTSRFDEYLAAVRDVDRRLKEAGGSALLYIEYAVGLPVEAFLAVFEKARDLERVSACVDISHVGIRQCQRAYEKMFPGEDVCGLKAHHRGLRERAAEVEAACTTALPVTRSLVGAIAALGKPMHFHLHDGHPASTFNQFGVSDHLSFFDTIPVPFSHNGAQHLPLIFGPLGLKSILDAARAALPEKSLSLTVEVHPSEGHAPLPLGEYAVLFSHWRDTTNAQRMNRWVDELLRCAQLVRECVGAPAVRPGGSPR